MAIADLNSSLGTFLDLGTGAAATILCALDDALWIGTDFTTQIKRSAVCPGLSEMAMANPTGKSKMVFLKLNLTAD